MTEKDTPTPSEKSPLVDSSAPKPELKKRTSRIIPQLKFKVHQNQSQEETHDTGYESLSALEPHTTKHRRNKYEEALEHRQDCKHATGSSPLRWVVNALIGFTCGIVSFLLKESIALLFRWRTALIVDFTEKDNLRGTNALFYKP